MNFVPEIYT